MYIETLKDLDYYKYKPLGIKLTVKSDIKALRDSFKALYRAFPTKGPWLQDRNGLTFSALERPNGSGDKSPFVISEGDRPVHNTTDEEELLLYLEWLINGAVINRLGEFYQIHAGVVGKNGKGLLLPGPSESGKTTLLIGLLKNGFRYLSDEVALIDPETLRVLPFPRNLHVPKVNAKFLSLSSFPGPGSWPKIQERKFQIEIRMPAAQAGDPMGVTHVIFPSYSSSRKPKLTPISRGMAVLEMVKSSLNFMHYGKVGVDTLIRLLAKAECFILTSNDLKQTVDLISAQIECP